MIDNHARSIPPRIAQESVLIQLATAYHAIAKKLEKRTNCSETRGYVLAAFRGDVTLNQNQIARALGLDRTVVHRTIRALIKEGLLTEKKATSGRALLLRLSSRGRRYRELLIQQRRVADEKVRAALTVEERGILLRLLAVVRELEI